MKRKTINKESERRSNLLHLLYEKVCFDYRVFDLYTNLDLRDKLDVRGRFYMNFGGWRGFEFTKSLIKK